MKFKTGFTQLFCVAFITVLIFLSCKKRDDDMTTPPQAPLKLTEFKNETDITTFEYNADGTLKSIQLTNDPVSMDDNVAYTVKYLANKKIDELNGSNGARIKLSYVNELLSKAEVFDRTIKISQTDYVFEGTVLKSSTISLMDDNTTVPFFKGEFVFNSAGNITRSNSFVYNPVLNRLEASGYVNNQYDNKANPFYALNDVMLIFWQVAPKNNVTKAEYFNANNGAEEVVETTYTYNAQGYPTKATMKETEQGQQPTTATITFKYK